MNQLHCRDAGFECDAVVSGDSVAEVMAQVSAHAETVHGVSVTPAMAEAIAQKVRHL